MEDDSEKKSKRIGPHGVGDPDDMRLRHVERDVLVSRMVSAVAIEKCADLGKIWGQCQADNGLAAVFACRRQGHELKKCLVYWTYNPEVVQQCTEKYLEARSDFRRTGIYSDKRVLKTKMKSDISAH